jgi:hypothetical protein
MFVTSCQKGKSKSLHLQAVIQGFVELLTVPQIGEKQDETATYWVF